MGRNNSDILSLIKKIAELCKRKDLLIIKLSLTAYQCDLVRFCGRKRDTGTPGKCFYRDRLTHIPVVYNLSAVFYQ